jgi:hypothetical protein
MLLKSLMYGEISRGKDDAKIGNESWYNQVDKKSKSYGLIIDH